MVSPFLRVVEKHVRGRVDPASIIYYLNAVVYRSSYVTRGKTKGR